MQVKIKELMERYGLRTRQTIYNWCSAAKVELSTDTEGHKYANPAQLDQLDDLKKHIDNGGNLKNYIPMSKTVLDTPLDSTDKLNKGSVQETLDSTPELLLKMVEIMSKHLTPTDNLSTHRQLEDAMNHGWILSTSEVKELIGTKPRCTKDTNTYSRGCWVFTKTGKIGNEAGWSISKNH